MDEKLNDTAELSAHAPEQLALEAGLCRALEFVKIQVSDLGAPRTYEGFDVRVHATGELEARQNVIV